MDAIRNPFSPGAGSPPPELAGRDTILDQARVLLGRVKQGRMEKSLLLTGLRGVGKTVLLNEIERQAFDEGYKTILIEATESKHLPTLLVPHLRKVLFDLDRIKAVGDKVKRGLKVLRSFIGAIKVSYGDIRIGLDVDPEQGTADSGDLEVDIPDLLIAVAEAAEERGVAVAILIDEVQYFSSLELSSLIMAMHKMQQRQLPLVLFGAGLPVLFGLAGESKSYAERLFSFPSIGPLSRSHAIKALQEPVKEAGESFEQSALDEIYQVTKGYPYFLQEWGYQCWNIASDSPITRRVVLKATSLVRDRLDQNFFRVRFDRLTPREKDYLRTMAELGDGSYRTANIADTMGKNISKLGPIRAALLKKGMIYSPSHGEIDFTVPLFDKFMLRAMPKRKPTT